MNEDKSKKTSFTLDRFEGGKAVLLGDKREFLVPKKYIPKSVNEGDIIHLTFSSDEVERAKKEKTAKEILNEILGHK